jgi:Family of unknown function (DUF6629)
LAARAGRPENRAYVPMAVIPLVFAAQQFCEAGVWAGLSSDLPDLVKPAALAFLFFAVAFWPFWIPYSAAALEDRPGKRLLFITLTEMGLVLGCVGYIPAAINFDGWVKVRVVNHSIRYDFASMPWARTVVGWLWGGLYLVAVCCPLLMTRDRRLRWLGVAIAVSAVISHVLFWYAFASVWCFFAALLSLHIAYVLYRLPEPAPVLTEAVSPPPGQNMFSRPCGRGPARPGQRFPGRHQQSPF